EQSQQLPEPYGSGKSSLPERGPAPLSFHELYRCERKCLLPKDSWAATFPFLSARARPRSSEAVVPDEVAGRWPQPLVFAVQLEQGASWQVMVWMVRRGSQLLTIVAPDG